MKPALVPFIVRVNSVAPPPKNCIIVAAFRLSVSSSEEFWNTYWRSDRPNATPTLPCSPP